MVPVQRHRLVANRGDGNDGRAGILPGAELVAYLDFLGRQLVPRHLDDVLGVVFTVGVLGGHLDLGLGAALEFTEGLLEPGDDLAAALEER